MKLNLPLALRNALISASLLNSASTIYAGDMNAQMGYELYRNLAENLDGFSPGATNVKIYDIDGQYVGTIPVMPDFGAFSGPTTQHSLAGGQSWVMECWHNRFKPDFTFSKVQGAAGTPVEELYTAIKRVTPLDQEEDVPDLDLAIARSNKVVTDAIHWELATEDKYTKDLAYLKEANVWRIGSGTQLIFEPGSEASEWLNGGYATVTAGTVGVSIMHVYTEEVVNGRGETATVELSRKYFGNLGAANSTNNILPLPTNAGDSGSPTIVYNEETKSWQLTSLHYGAAYSGEVWTNEIGYGNYSHEFFNFVIDSSAHSFNSTVSTWSFGASNENGLVSISDGTKNDPTSIRTLKQGERGATSTVGTAADDAEMWLALDWVFAANQATTLNFDGDFDTGAGSMQFRRGTTGGVTYTLQEKPLKNADGSVIVRDTRVNINTAGYIVEEGVTVKSSLTGKAGDEWRIVGENARMEGPDDENLNYVIYGGVFEITGTGDNLAHLNLGVGITVLLNRAGDAQAAQDVQINTGATVILGSSTQIGGDLEFGNMGGILDLNGHDFQRNNDTLYTFDEDARIVNFHASNHSEYSHTLNTAEQELITAGFFDAASAGDPTLQGELSLSFTGEVAGASAWLRNNISIAGTVAIDNASVTLSGYNVEVANFEVVPNNVDYRPATDPTKWVRTEVSTGSMTVSNSSHLIIGSHVDVNTPSLTVDASSKLSIEGYGALNTDVNMQGQAHFADESQYAGHLTLHSGASLTTEGVMDTAFTLSALAGSTTQFNATVTLADGSSNAGTMNSSSMLTLEGAFTNTGSLNLNGELVLAQSFSNTGTLSFGRDFLLNLNTLTANASPEGTLSYTIFTGSNSATFDVLSSNNILLQNSDSYVWDFFSDGTVFGTMLTDILIYNGGRLDLSVGATGFESGSFANQDSIDFKTADSTLVVTEAGLQAERLLVTEGVNLTIQSSGGHSISAERVLLESGSSITITGESLAADDVVNLAMGAVETTIILDMDGLDIANKAWLNRHEQALALRDGFYDHGSLPFLVSSVDIAADATLKVSSVEDFSILLTGSGDLQVNNIDILRLSQAVDYHGVLSTDAAVIHFENFTGAGVAFTPDQELYLHVTGNYTGAMSGAGEIFAQVGDITLSNLTAFTGILHMQDGKLTIGSSASLSALVFPNGNTLEIAAGNHTVSVSADDLYTRNVGNDTIIVGAGATLRDNVYLRMATDTLTLSGGGTYEITKFMGADGGSTSSVINIAANTTLKVTYDTTTGDSNAGGAFMISHWGAGGANTEINVSGTLDLNSGLSNKDGVGEINVADNASLILRKGLYAIDAGNNAGALSINAAAGSTVQLYDQQANTAAGVLIADFEGGAAIEAMSATTTISNALRLSGTGNVSLTATQANATVNVNGAITAAEGSTAGLAITGTSGQTFNINAANSYAGDTIITGASVVAGNTAAFGTTGSITVNSGSLELGGQAVSNNITAAGGSLAGFNAYTGELSITGAVSATDLAGTISIANSASLTMNGTWLYNSAIANEGSIIFGHDLTLDLSNSLFRYAEGGFKLDLMTGTGSLDASSWLTGGEVDTTKITGIDLDARTFSYANGVLSFTTEANILVWAGGDATWDTDTANTPWLHNGTASGFTSGDYVNFTESTHAENTITLVGELNPFQIIVDSAQNYSLVGAGSLTGDTQLIKTGAGTLTIATANSYAGGTKLYEGRLRIQNMNALGSAPLDIVEGTLALYGGIDVAINAQNITLSSGKLNVELESTNATLSNASSLGSHVLNVSGSGMLSHDKWASISSVNVAAGATVFFSEANADVTTHKTISGEGTIRVGHTNGNRNFRTQFDLSNPFSGTLELVNNGDVVMDIDHSTADYRSALILGASSELVITADAAATLYLDGLSGEGQMRFDWNSDVLAPRNINLQMSENQNFAGNFLSIDDERMCNVIVSSVEGAHHTFTLSGTGMSSSDTQADNGKLIIENATVSMSNDAVWNGAIQLTENTAVLEFNGNALTRDAEAGAISGLGSVHVNANTTLNGVNSYSRETIVDNAATLTVGNVDALGTSAVTVNSGTLNLAGLGVSNSITAAGGNLAGFSSYAGALNVTGNASVADTITGNISIAVGGILNLNGTWDYSQAISNEGTLTFGSNLTLDLTDVSFTKTEDTYILNLMTGLGSLDVSSWLIDGKVDSTKLSGIILDARHFSYSNGVLSYIIVANNITWGGGSGTWAADESYTPWLNGGVSVAYSAGDFVLFGESSSAENTVTLVGELIPNQISVDSAQNYSFEGTGSLAGATELIKAGSGTLSIGMENSYSGGTTLNAGTLRIQNMNALGTGPLEIESGTLAFYGGTDVTIDAQDIILNSDTLNIALEGTNATLSNASSFGTHALNVSGSGIFTHDKWSALSSVDVGAGATVYFNETNVNTEELKTITGAGTIRIGNTTQWKTRVQLDASNLFTGTFEMMSSARAVMFIEGSSADQRMSLALGASSDLVFYSSVASTLYLDSLTGSGQIRFDWGNTVTRDIDLEISSDQEFAGKFAYSSNRMGNFIVGSVGEQHHTFTFSDAVMGSNDTGTTHASLIIENATVAMTKDAVWNGTIQLTTNASVLDFKGDATTRGTGAGSIRGAGSVHVNTTTTLNGANSYFGDTIIGNAATLNVGNVSALGTSDVTLNSGTLNLGGHAVSNNVTAAGGSLAGLSTYAGALNVTGSVSVADTITGNISIAADGNLSLSGTWDYSQAMVNEGTLSFGSGLTLDLSDASFSEFTGGISLELFSGTGVLDMSSWLTGGEIDASRITGVTLTEGYSFSYDAGTLSYTMGDIHIAADEDKPLTGSIIQDVIFDSPSGVAVLGNGFSQGTGTSFNGEGNIQITDAASITLDKASTDFSGTTSVGAGSSLTIAAKDALGTSQVETAADASIIIAEGQSIENSAKLAAGASIQAGVLTVTGQAGGAGSVGEGIVSHTETGEGRITGNLMSSVDISLAANGVGKISNSTLSNTNVIVGSASELLFEGGTMGEDTQFRVVDGSSLRFDGTHFSSLKENTFSVVTRSIVSLEDIITVSNSSVDVAITAAPEQVTLDGNLINLYKLDGVEFVLNQTTIENQLFLEITGIDLASLIGRSGFGFSLTGVAELQAGLDFSNLVMSNNGTRISMERMSTYEGNIVLYNAAVPEPSTATLSLLALAGLLARRRRRVS